MQNLFSSLQSAIAINPSSNPETTQATAEGGYKSHTLDAIQYQLRSFGQQYTTTSKLQKLITVEKGVAIDFDGVSRDSKSQSKELYTWGQTELDDLKDVTDRIAYLNFVQGSLASNLAIKLDGARLSLKAVRDAETALAPRRESRSGLQLQITRLETHYQSGMEKRVAELKEQLRKAEAQDDQKEKEVELLKRKAVRESEQIKWDALREYGEKLVLLSQAASGIIAALPSIPPTQSRPYTGAQTTAAMHASLDRALDNYKTGHITLPAQLAAGKTTSFGESHASELSNIYHDAKLGLPVTPPTTSSPLPMSPPQAEGFAQPSGINPLQLNQSPAQLPTPLVTSPNNSEVIPTVAETGVPVIAGAQGPGPASGSLRDVRAQSDASTQSAVRSSTAAVAPKYESAEEEKKRLQRAERENLLRAQPSGTAEEERKRQEREQRENQGNDPTTDEGDELPPYPDF